MLTKWLWAGCIVVMGVALVSGAALAADATKTDAKTDVKAAEKTEAKAEPKAEVKLTDAAAKAIKEAFPKAVVGAVEAEKGLGVNAFEVKAKDEKGADFEVVVGADGTIVCVETVVTDKDLPEAAAKAVKAVEGAKVAKVEKQVVSAEVQKTNAGSKLVKLEKAKTQYEVGFEKDGKKGKMVVAEDGTVVTALAWKDASGKKAEEKAPVAPKVDTKPAAAVTATVAPVATPTAPVVTPTAAVAPKAEK